MATEEILRRRGDISLRYLLEKEFFAIFALMKRKRILVWLLPLLTMVGCMTVQERAEQQAKMRKAVVEAVASRHLHIDIRSMSTLRYGSKMVTSDFFLELQGDTLCSDLPYWGQAYQAPVGSSSIGLNFEAPILRYSESRPKANKTQLELDVRTQEDTYHYLIELYDTGESYICVRSLNRDPISFDGTIGKYAKN